MKVAPLFNRCVIFSTTAYSYHGHPDPLLCPEGTTRKSMALYYFTNGRPAEELGDLKGTDFMPRPGEVWRRWATMPTTARRWLPPVLVDRLATMQRRRERRRRTDPGGT